MFPKVRQSITQLNYSIEKSYKNLIQLLNSIILLVDYISCSIEKMNRKLNNRLIKNIN